jgi:hypothetical protein
MTTLATLAALLVSSGVALAQPAALPAGHWTGAIQVPGQELKVEVDLTRSGDAWQGAIAIPAQNLRNFPLSNIVVLADAVGFTMEGVPGTPRFKGTVDREKQTLSGEFSQGEATIPFALARTGEAKFEPPPSSTPITKELAGEWNGALEVNGQTLRLVLKLTAEADRPGTGVLVSLDQGGVEIPVTAVIQAGAHVTVVVQRVAGRFEGDLKDGQLSGTWTQGPGTLPLVFTRAQ